VCNLNLAHAMINSSTCLARTSLRIVMCENAVAAEFPKRAPKFLVASYRTREFPEADQAQWFGVDEARQGITKRPIPVVDALADGCNDAR
jgi:predicted NUDIX family NTP pyrophosphohydrolase